MPVHSSSVSRSGSAVACVQVAHSQSFPVNCSCAPPAGCLAQAFLGLLQGSCILKYFVL